MPCSTGRAETTAKLHAIGGQSIPGYLERTFPHADTSSANQRFVDAAEQTIDEMLHPMRDEMQDVDEEVPLYIKVRGKGKGKPVIFDPTRSSVAQIYGKLPSNPSDERGRSEGGRVERRCAELQCFVWMCYRCAELAAQQGVPDPIFTHTATGAA